MAVASEGASGTRSDDNLHEEDSDLTNQWGRDSDVRSGGRRGGAGIVIAVLAALVLGGAGGYATSWFLQADAIVADGAERAQTAELAQALAKARDDLNAARVAEASSAAEVESLKADIARMAGDLDAMAEKLAAGDRPTAAPDETNGAMEALRRERDALAAENEAFKAGLEALEAERQALEQQAKTDGQRLQDELERLQGDLVPELTSERDRLKRETQTLLADQAALEAQIKTASEAQAADAARIAELEARLRSAEEELEAARQAIETLGNESKAALNADRVGEAGSQAVQPPAEAGVQDAASVLDPRDPDAVARALRAAPGLETLSEADRQQLTDRLVRGECVTSALESLFERVPILTLRNLIRDLNSGC
jgi:predicted  nucleic acid-binding Zn-ribbon protein